MKKKKTEKKSGQKNNREYTNIMLVFSGLFILMIGYLFWFQAAESREVINNPYNARLETFEKKVIRGNILASDGQLLAYTRVASDGTEDRIYPFDCTFSHVLGYSEYGRTGIEELGNFQLLTSNAYFIEKFVNELREQKNIGDSLITTLDVKLQTAAHDALGTKKGAAVVMEAATGNVLAMVSKPDYDPSDVKTRWKELESSGDSVLLNRALQGLYPPGSIFKTVTLLEYLREHGMEESYSYDCTGKAEVGNTAIRCYHGKAHGQLDLAGAFSKSCNSAFADMGRALTVDSWQQLSDQLLFNQELPVPFPYKKSSFQAEQEDSEALRMMTAIGQGNTLVTPMHMALLMSAIANDGVLMTPRFLERTENYLGDLVEEYPKTVYGNLMTKEEAELLRRYLRGVVEEGTASALQSDRYEAGGKTGTAEYSSNKKKSHAWFTGYVSGEKPEIVVSVIVEEAGSGSEYAVPVAKRIFDAYYSEE